MATPITAYTQVLSTQSAVGQNRYAVKLKNLTAGGAWARVKVKASPAGPCTWQSMYIGKHGGNNFDFTAAGVPVLFGGASAVTKAANQEQWSDPLQLNTVIGDSLVARFDINGSAGQYYFYGAVSETETLAGYNNGLIGAANGNQTAGAYTLYSSNSGRYAHSIVAIEVADTLEAFDPPSSGDGGSGGISMLRDIELIGLANGLAASSDYLTGVAGERRVITLENPSGSERVVFFDKIELLVETTGLVRVHISSGGKASNAVAMPKCNTNFKAPYSIGPKATAYAGSEVNIVGGQHAIHPIVGGEKETLTVPIGFHSILHPGETGSKVIIDAPGAAVHVHLEWHERSI